MEGAEIIDSPFGFESVHGLLPCTKVRGHQVGAEDNHVQSSGRGVVNPFRREKPYRMERGQIDLLGIYQFVVGDSSYVFYVVHEERIGGSMMG